MREKILYTKFLLRVPRESIERIENALRKRYGITKSDWIREAINEKFSKGKKSA